MPESGVAMPFDEQSTIDKSEQTTAPGSSGIWNPVGELMPGRSQRAVIKLEIVSIEIQPAETLPEVACQLADHALDNMRRRPGPVWAAFASQNAARAARRPLRATG